MSHTAKIKSVPINDVSALRRAVDCLKVMGIDCDLVDNQVPRMFYDNQVKSCQHVLKLYKGRYDVGFETNKEGGLTPVLDTWGGHVSRVLGVDSMEGVSPAETSIGKLLREYSKEVALGDAVEQGYFINSCELDSKGEYQIYVETGV